MIEASAVDGLVRHVFSEALKVDRLVEGLVPWPDCFVPDKNLVIEVKEILSPKDLKESSQASKTMRAVEEKLRALKLPGSYSIDLPYLNNGRQTDPVFNEIVTTLTSELRNLSAGGRSDIRVSIAKGIFANIYRLESETDDIFVGATSDFEVIDPELPEARSEIERVLTKAGVQIANFKGEQTVSPEGWILLVLKNFRLARREFVIKEAIASHPASIDQIWSVSASDSNQLNNDWRRWK